MSTITVTRSDVTSDEVADALRQGLGSRYKVLPGTGVRLADGDIVRLGGDASAEVSLPRQEADPATF